MSDKKTSKDAERDLLAPVSFDEFKKPTYEQWQAEVEKALKGGDFHKKMFTKTYEGITLQPIYTPALHGEKIPKGVYPGAGEFLRGTKASGYLFVSIGAEFCHCFSQFSKSGSCSSGWNQRQSPSM